jgi:hypothetical protein
VLTLLIINVAIFQLIGVTVWLSAWPHRYVYGRKLACGMTLGLLAVFYTFLIASQRRPILRSIALGLWIVVLGLALGFMGVAFATLIPVLMPGTLLVTYAAMLLFSLWTRNVLRFAPYMGISFVVTCVTVPIWFACIHRTLDDDIFHAGGALWAGSWPSEASPPSSPSKYRLGSRSSPWPSWQGAATI